MGYWLDVDSTYMCGLCLATLRKLKKHVAWRVMTEPELDTNMVHAWIGFLPLWTLLGMCTSMMPFFHHWRLQNRHIYYFMMKLWRYGIRHWMRVIFYLPWRNVYFRHRCAFVLWWNGRRHRSVFFLWRSIFIIDIAPFSSWLAVY